MEIEWRHVKEIRAGNHTLLLVRRELSMWRGCDRVHHILDASPPGQWSKRALLCGAAASWGPCSPGYDGKGGWLCGMCWDAFESPNLSFHDLEEFYAADGRRWPSGESDYGYWYDHIPPECWRVSYVRETGEVYACRTQDGECVRVLGVFPADDVDDRNGGHWYRTLDRVLEGWPDHCRKPWGLTWLKERLRLAAVNGSRRTPSNGVLLHFAG